MKQLPLQYGMLYFDNAYPLKMGWWDIRYSLLKPGWRSLERKAKTELVPPEKNMPFHFKIGGIEPRYTFPPFSSFFFLSSGLQPDGISRTTIFVLR